MSKTERFRRGERLFHELVELEAAERSRRLDELGEQDAELGRFVAGLLERHDRWAGDTGVGDSAEPGRDSLAALFDRLPRLGPYQLQRRIGQGGMGVVYEATQSEPLRRQVAVKLTSAGLDNERVLARFDAERQALALMSHPGIAQVLDAGTAPDGRPYFVMELVEGPPITAFCDQQRMPVGERLGLFLKVCEAVEHAHRKGILHRDLKPSNILVTTPGDGPIPKIIDFGIAKALGPRDATDSSLTRQGDIIGTPEYMSPEQTLGDGVDIDIDTRTDVYSLGVLLYELLCGQRPLAKELAAAPADSAYSIIRERESERPSRRLTVGDSDTGEVAERRQTDAEALRRRLRGDLDWIALKALAKDREQRYAAVAELAADVRRHLEHRPVEAGPPSRLYRARKLVRRHRLAVVAGALVLLSLVAGIIGTSVGMLRARESARLAATEAATAAQVTEFLVDLFEVSDPGEARGNTVTAREVLDRAAADIEDSLEHEPAVRARLLTAIGNIYDKLGLYEPALAQLSGAVELRRSLFEVEPSVPRAEELARSHHLQGRVQRKLGDREGAEASIRAALELREDATGERVKQLGDTLNELALLRRQSDPQEALELYRRSLAINRKVHGDDEHINIAVLLANVGGIEARSGSYEAAIASFQEALAVLERTVGDDHPLVGGVLSNLGYAYRRLGRFAEARPVLERSVEIAVRVNGPLHPNTGGNLGNLARLLVLLGDYDAAFERAEQALAAQEQSLGPSHPQVLRELRLLAEIAGKQGRIERARELAEEALGRVSAAPEEQRIRLRMVLLAQLAEVERRGDPEQAELLARQALTLPAADLERASLGQAQLALAHALAGRDAEAFEQALGEALRVLGELPDAQAPELAFAEARARALAGQEQRALELLGEAVAQGFADAEVLVGEDFTRLRELPSYADLAARVRERLGAL